jgi:hypothetical protein
MFSTGSNSKHARFASFLPKSPGFTLGKPGKLGNTSKEWVKRAQNNACIHQCINVCGEQRYYVLSGCVLTQNSSSKCSIPGV